MEEHQNPEISKPTQEAINDIKNMKKAMHKASTQTEDVKNGNKTPEEEQADPGYILFDHISDVCIELLQLPDIINSMNDIASIITPSIGKENADKIMSDICTIMAVMTTHSSFRAIAFYDNEAAKSLNQQFNAYNDVIAKMGGIINGHSGVLEVFKQQIEECRQKLGLVNIKPETSENEK